MARRVPSSAQKASRSGEVNSLPLSVNHTSTEPGVVVCTSQCLWSSTNVRAADNTSEESCDLR
eukprot:7057395-Prymnesium_polylepis.1